jgi:peptidoglycan/xylan/chitin deacetylase (PgdA/CDA1 family)
MSRLIVIAVVILALTYVPGVVVRAWQVGRLRRAICGRLLLTYDDGPSPLSPTPQILEVLRRHGAKATFFLLGAQAVKGEALCERLVAEGHDIGAHGFRHVNGWEHPVRAVPDLVQGLRTVARWRQGLPIYRQPYGKSTLWTLLAAARWRARAVWWTVDSGDSWLSTPDCDSILRRVERDEGGVVLMHDFPREASSAGVRFTLELTEKLLELAVRRGWTVSTVSELFGRTANRAVGQPV